MLKKILLTCFTIISLVGKGFGQERSFANVTFKFTELSYSLYLSELDALEKNQTLNLEELSKFAATRPIIEPILSAVSIPDDFKILSLYKKHQNSLLSKNQLESGVLWGFTEEMADEVNLLVNHQIDERKHLFTATHAATAYIQRNQILYQNWGITLFAHLAEKDVLNQLNIVSKWKGKYIVLDSPDYKSVIEFLAFKAYIEINFPKIGNIEHKMVYSVSTAGGKTLGYLSEKLGLSIHEIIASNQWLISGFIPQNNKYPVLLYIPISKYFEIKKLENSSPEEEIGVQGFPILQVNETLSMGLGGTFYSINGLPGIQAQMCDKSINLAYKADLSNSKFLEYNDLRPTDDILIGSIYYLKHKRDKADIPFHIAKTNETLWEISQMYGVKLKKLLDYNRMDGITKLIPGQLIYMREKRSKNEPIPYIPIESNEKSKELPVENTLAASHTISSTDEPKETLVYFSPKNIQEEEEDKTASLAASSSKEDHVSPSVVNQSRPKPKFMVHEVMPGETLNEISSTYKVDIKKLLELNNLINSKIEQGDRLIIRKN